MKENEYNLWITYNTDRFGGGYLSNEPYSDREDEYTDINITGARINHPGGWPEGFKVDFEVVAGKTVYPVVVRYTSGDTFGTSYGNFKFIGVYETFEEAIYVKDSIYNGTYNKGGYNCWEGYFERLERVEIDPHVLV